MQDAKSLFDQFFGPAQGASGFRQGDSRGIQNILSGPGGLATGALAGGIAGLLLGGKKPRKMAKTALKVGGVALVGGLAYKAWRDWQAGKPLQASGTSTIETPPTGSAFEPSARSDREKLYRSIIRSMIAAAKADGHVSAEERNRISRHLETMEVGPEHRRFIEDELTRPLDIDAVVSGATCPEQAAEIYAASLLVVDQEDAAGRGYLAMLAARLELDAMLVEYLHAGAETAVEKQAA